MRIDVDQFSFEIPPGFEDGTSYTFKDAQQQAALTVTFGMRPPEAADLAALMALRRENLDLLVPGAKVEEEVDTRVDGIAGRMLSFTFEDRRVTFRSHWAVAFSGPDRYMEIAFVTPAADKEAVSRFQHVLGSVVPASRNPEAVSPPAYKRRWARYLTLDVPVSLAPPRTYQFYSADGSIRFTISSFNLKDPSVPVPSEDEEIARDAAGGAVVGARSRRALAAPAGQAGVVAYSLTRQQDSGTAEDAARRAYLHLRDGTGIHISARSPAASEAQMDPLFTQLILSVQESK